MKISLILSATAAIYFFTACNNSTDTSTTDTTTVNTDSVATVSAPMQDTTKMDNGMMGAMNNMMDKMNSMKMSGDFDIDFANMLIEHHQGAIDMAQVELSQGKDEKMKSKAQKIITKQKDEQQKLRGIVSSYKPSGMKHGEGELQKSMSAMSDKMKSMQMSGDIDKDFATMMSSHHEDGISMSKLELKNGMNSQLKQKAQKGITDQTKDITEFKNWLRNKDS